MDLKDTLAKLDAFLAPAPQPQPTTMTKAQFDAYVAAQIEKAKKEYSEEEDKKKGAKKARKRLEILRNLVATVAKTDFGQGAPGLFGDEGVKIPVFAEADISRFAEMSESEQATPPAPGGLMADGQSFADPRGQTDWNVTHGTGGPSGGANLPAIGGTAGDPSPHWAAQGGQSDFAKSLDALKKTIDEVIPTQQPAAAAGAPRTEPTAADFAWPSDLAATEEIIGKEAVTKRAPESWGKDAAPAK